MTCISIKYVYTYLAANNRFATFSIDKRRLHRNVMTNVTGSARTSYVSSFFDFRLDSQSEGQPKFQLRSQAAMLSYAGVAKTCSVICHSKMRSERMLRPFFFFFFWPSTYS